MTRGSNFFFFCEVQVIKLIPPSSRIYLQYTYEDAMDLIAKLPTLAAAIYRNLYRDGKVHNKASFVSLYENVLTCRRLKNIILAGISTTWLFFRGGEPMKLVFD